MTTTRTRLAVPLLATLALTALACTDGVSRDPGAEDDGGEEPDGAPGDPDGAPPDGASPDGAPGDAAPSRYPLHNIVADCAPGGGPALQIWLGESEEPDDCHPLYSSVGTLTVWVYTDDIQAPTTISFSPGEPNGSALVCPIGSPGDPSCFEIDEGEVEFEAYEVNDRRGTIRLRPQGPEPIVERFDASLCEGTEPPPTCE